MNYICDVIRLHCTDGTILEAALRNKQWGMEETYYRIGGKDSAGNMRWFWPRVNNNIATQGHWISLYGADEGIYVSPNGAIGVNTINGGSYAVLIKMGPSIATEEAIMIENHPGTAVGSIGISATNGNLVFSLGPDSSDLTEYMKLSSLCGAVCVADGKNLSFGSGTGSKIGKTNAEKIGFWGSTPVAQAVLATGSSTDQLITALQNIGLIRQA